MTTVEQPGRFTTLPDEETLAATVVALEEHGFSVEVVDSLDAAREAVLARIPEGSSVMTNTSVTLEEAGIAAAVNEDGPYESARNKMMALDFATQLQEMKAIAGQPDFALGSVHAITRDGTLVIASASGSQLASYVWGAAHVIFVVGAQKLVSSADEARQRIDRAQSPARGRAGVRRLRAEQPDREDPRDPPGEPRAHPRRSRPAVRRLLRVAMSAEIVTHPAVGAEDRRRWFALGVIVTAQFMVVLDISIVNVALPSIKTDLHFSQESLQWVITAYSIFFGGFLLLGGRLADLFGRRRLLMAGLALFTVSSLLERARLVGGLADRVSLLAGSRRRHDVARCAVDPDHDVPGGSRAQSRARDLGRRGGQRWRCRRAAGRRPDQRVQLAVDLLRQRARRRCCPRGHARCSCARAAPTCPIGTSTSPVRRRSRPG